MNHNTTKEKTRTNTASNNKDNSLESAYNKPNKDTSDTVETIYYGSSNHGSMITVNERFSQFLC